MINRINLILRAKNITARQFAEEIGIQPSGMSHILGGRNNPSLDFVTKVIRRYPEIDANWLLLGRGEMYTSAAPSPVVAPVESVPEAAPVSMPEPTLFAEEPTLFAEEPVMPLEEKEPLYEPQGQQDVFVQEEVSCEPPYEAEVPAPVAPGTPRLERMLFVYSDGTFREYRPQK